LLLGAALFIWYMKANPPLYSSGWSTNNYPDKQGVIIEISNKGFAGLKIEKVYINGNETPEAAELGISKTDALVQMFSQCENNSLGISYHKLNEYKIMPDSMLEQNRNTPGNDKELVKHYGIYVQNFGRPIESISIKYSYLGIPFTLLLSSCQPSSKDVLTIDEKDLVQKIELPYLEYSHPAMVDNDLYMCVTDKSNARKLIKYI
jgi:hypothetical protein